MSLFDVKVDVDYLKHTLPVPLREICNKLRWDVYIDYDIDQILVTTDELNNIFVSIIWEGNIPVYVFYKTKTATDHRGRLQVHYTQAKYGTNEIDRAIKILLKEIPFEDQQ